jgi:superfamily II DNA/RNA helicase
MLHSRDGKHGGGPQETHMAAVCVSQVTVLVLDEADRMLDMGFEKDIAALAALLPSPRQTLLFTATWPPTVQAAAARLLTADASRPPLHLSIGAAAAASGTVAQVSLFMMMDNPLVRAELTTTFPPPLAAPSQREL